MSYVYLIEAQNGVAKIGCARDPYQRLAAVRTHSPVLVRLIAIWPGNYAGERLLHARFDQHRLASEWFQIDGTFRQFVAESHGTGLDAVQPWSDLTFHNAGEKTARSKRLRQAAMKEIWRDPVWKLEQLASLAEGRAVKKALGPNYWVNEQPEQRARRDAIQDQARQKFFASDTAIKLKAEIAALVARDPTVSSHGEASA